MKKKTLCKENLYFSSVSFKEVIFLLRKHQSTLLSSFFDEISSHPTHLNFIWWYFLTFPHWLCCIWAHWGSSYNHGRHGFNRFLGLGRFPGKGRLPTQYSKPEIPWTVWSIGSQSQARLVTFTHQQIIFMTWSTQTKYCYYYNRGVVQMTPQALPPGTMLSFPVVLQQSLLVPKIQVPLFFLCGWMFSLST